MNIFQQYIHMSAVRLYECAVKHYVKIIYIIILPNSDTNVYML